MQDELTHLLLETLLEGLQRHLLPGQHQQAAGQPAQECLGHLVLAQPDPGMLLSACAVALMEVPSHHLMEDFGWHLTPHPEAASACVVRQKESALLPPQMAQHVARLPGEADWRGELPAW